jgi:hypothetical protein
VSLKNDLANRLRGALRIFMLPNPDGEPAGLFESTVGVPIALDVPIQLLRPPLRVGSGDGSMRGAPVPEAAVDEDGDFRWAEYDVCAASNFGHDFSIDAKTETEPMKLTSKGEFGLGVAAPLQLHPTQRLR